MGFINVFDIPAQSTCSARGNANISIPAGGAMTKIPLNVWASHTDNTIFTFNDSGIKINKTGDYLVSAGLSYSTYPSNADYGVYVYDSSGAEIVSSRSYNHAANSYVGGVGTGAKIVSITAGTTLYLNGRCVSVAGTVVGTNADTFLTIVKM